MKHIIVLLASMTLFSGCASTQTIKQLETQSSQGVFHVVTQGQATPASGFGDLQVLLDVKTRTSGTALIDTTNYGTEQYQLLVGVNGQTHRVSGTMRPEIGEYRGSTDPEAGNGVRYRFATTLRLPVGTHRISFALPGDHVVLEQEVRIEQGIKRVELKPVYRAKNPHRLFGFRGERTFYQGVKALEIRTNNS